MTRALVAFVALVLAGCGGPKPPAPASSLPRPESAAPALATPATPAPAPAPAPSVSAPVTPAPAAPSSSAPSSSTPTPPSSASRPPAAPEPAPQVLYVKTHLANFREGAGTSRKILRVLRQGARLQVLETRTTWLRVRLDDGQEGWVSEAVTSVTAPVTPARAPAPRSRLTRVASA